ncbi:protein translocase subunit secA [Sinobacterium caligoides]|uniref:Protein translocase subunit SecA n=1 Tax=Sinobacterium caligoides TaxID=933926 RepID=A0A3N2D4T8_9GAMM|nr:preprotein translocase subunit SecA [Sinobacterium caligoides]ROR94773.1 protein translocase subunit secA [Sinobacterium caligoides]
MIVRLLRKVLGTKNDRELKRMRKLVVQINAYEEAVSALSDEQLQGKTPEFKQQLADGKTLDEILPEAFAVCREASKRVMGMRHFDVQLIGGITLHEGRIAEMRTGEGKTLVATLPVYLNALAGEGVHVVTVNDYLATRDANWMRPLYEFMGLTVGTVVPQQDPVSKRAAYASDIIYGTNNEFGFDYLRDNMAFAAEERFQRKLSFAIIDEVDSILIDEARTPLIISGPAEDHSELYRKVNTFIPSLQEAPEAEEGAELVGDYTIDEKQRQVELTESGHTVVEEWMVSQKLLEEGDSLYSSSNLTLLHHVHTALKAHILFQRDVDYIVQEKQVVLIDEHTGRTMQGRRLSEGLHQAIEAKEGVEIQSESQTLASTTFQNYFRLYDKLGGMTGTADTEAFEFHQIYGLDVIVLPTNREVLRKDLNDLIYLSKQEKFDAVVEDIREYQTKGVPTLVGTASIESSEELHRLLVKHKINHQVLNAKFHSKEADIIAQAGRPGAVTIATNMAGRGTDIVLGGNLEAEIAALVNPTEAKIAELTEAWEQRHQAVLDAGGLHIIGTERHESRRIDNQLRGRAGRQGDPGLSRFYLSLEDNLMRIFASDRVKNFMQALGMEKGEAIEHRMVTNAIEKAQKKVEGRNFDMRKQLLEFDDVANDQRQVIYQQRNALLEQENVNEMLSTIREDVVSSLVAEYVPPQSVEDMWDVPALEQQLNADFGLELPVQQWLDEDDDLHGESLQKKLVESVEAAYQEKSAMVGEQMNQFEKHIMLQVLDSLWKEHLATMDALRNGIHLRAYAQKNPKQEYKRESFELFQEMLENFKHEVVCFMSKVQVRDEDAERIEQQRREQQQAQQQLDMQHAETAALGMSEEGEAEGAETAKQVPVRTAQKVGRNDPCPCGSGQKFKQCHGKL